MASRTSFLLLVLIIAAAAHAADESDSYDYLGNYEEDDMAYDVDEELVYEVDDDSSDAKSQPTLQYTYGAFLTARVVPSTLPVSTVYIKGSSVTEAEGKGGNYAVRNFEGFKSEDQPITLKDLYRCPKRDHEMCWGKNEDTLTAWCCPTGKCGKVNEGCM